MHSGLQKCILALLLTSSNELQSTFQKLGLLSKAKDSPTPIPPRALPKEAPKSVPRWAGLPEPRHMVSRWQNSHWPQYQMLAAVPWDSTPGSDPSPGPHPVQGRVRKSKVIAPSTDFTHMVVISQRCTSLLTPKKLKGQGTKQKLYLLPRAQALCSPSCHACRLLPFLLNPFFH